MPLFVILRHEMPAESERSSHWDLMLEVDDTLRTWALLQQPDLVDEQPAEALTDHRLAYLEIEGPLSEDRGSVAQWDAGQYEVEEASEQHWLVTLDGKKLSGTFLLQANDAEPHCWRFSRSLR